MGKSNIICCAREVSVSYARWGQIVSALKAASLKVRRGEWLMLVGANGSGKSTLLKVMNGRIEPDNGKVLIEGKPTHKLSDRERARRVFMVHQDPLMGTAATLTVFENLRVADDEDGKRNRRALQDKYMKLLEPLGLEDRKNQRAQTLSGGERQMLALLIARLRRAPLILLDEPLAALDPVRSELCLKQISSLRDSGKTLVQVTHQIEHAVYYGDRTVVVRDGTVERSLEGDMRTLRGVQNLW